MKFQALSEEELSMLNLVKEGIYPFEVIEAKEDISKSSGNDMIKLKLKIWDQEGGVHSIFDYLLPSLAFKLRHFCNAVGIIDKYDLGEVRDSDCLGKQGHAHIIVQPGTQKLDGGYYPDKNSVKDYVIPMSPQGSITQPIKPKDDFVDNDLPF